MLTDGDLVLYETAAIVLHLCDTHRDSKMIPALGTIEQLKAHAEHKVAGLLDQLDAELARHGQPWFAGTAYSALDPYVFTLCRWTRNFANEQPARNCPHLGPYLQRMLARSAVQRVIQNERLSPPLV